VILNGSYRKRQQIEPRLYVSLVMGLIENTQLAGFQLGAESFF
jgi:hypothetical protein